MLRWCAAANRGEFRRNRSKRLAAIGVKFFGVGV